MHGSRDDTVSPLFTGMLTTLALLAFAANSIFCREALKTPVVDAASFTAIRLSSGAATLWFLARLLRTQHIPLIHKSWFPALMLFTYAIAFSFAYLHLSVGTGALILFGAVQGTMMTAGLLAGERLHLLEWVGFLLAISGFVALVSPGLSTPSLTGSLFMFIAGLAWGIYTLLGRETADPVLDTATNFLIAVPFGILACLLSGSDMHISAQGLLLAIAGGLTSGCGYVIWYRALKGLTAIQASIVQLAVPLLAAAGGILFLSEEITLRLFITAVLVLGGIGLGLGGLARRRAG